MGGFRIRQAASHRLDEISAHTRKTRGEARTDACLRALSERLGAIAARTFSWRRTSAEFGVDGCVCRYEKHFICWQRLDDGSVGIVAVLHDRMHQTDRFKDDLGR